MNENADVTNYYVCKNCGHTEEEHPNHFLCSVDAPHISTCRCPGWVKKVKGVND